MSDAKPKVGQWWYVKLPGAVALVKMQVHGVTKHTVLLRDESKAGFPTEYTRYATEDIDFIELLEE